MTATTTKLPDCTIHQEAAPSRQSMLLNLPREIFDHITATLLKDVGITRAGNARLVCRSLNTSIMEESIRIVSKQNFSTILQHKSSKKLYHFHGSAILQAMIRRDDKSDHTIIKFIHRVVGYLPQSPDLTRVQKELQHAQYTAKVCDAMQALDTNSLKNYCNGYVCADPFSFWTRSKLLPALAVMMGQVQVLERSLKKDHLQSPHCNLFPNALEVAVSAGQDKALDFILRFILENVERGSYAKKRSWSEMLEVTRSIGDALKLAIRLHKHSAAGVLFNFLTKNAAFKQFKFRYLGNQLVKASLIHRNTHTIIQSLEFDQTVTPEGSEKSTVSLSLLSVSHTGDIFRIGSKEMLQHLINHGQFDINAFSFDGNESFARTLGKITPLKLALSYSREDLAKVILDSGANIDAPLPHSKNTCLFEAFKYGKFKDVRFLLIMGADPDLPSHSQHKLSVRALAKRGRIDKCRFLVKKFTEFGKEYLEKKDLWEIYATQHPPNSYRYWR